MKSNLTPTSLEIYVGICKIILDMEMAFCRIQFSCPLDGPRTRNKNGCDMNE